MPFVFFVAAKYRWHMIAKLHSGLHVYVTPAAPRRSTGAAAAVATASRLLCFSRAESEYSGPFRHHQRPLTRIHRGGGEYAVVARSQRPGRRWWPLPTAVPGTSGKNPYKSRHPPPPRPPPHSPAPLRSPRRRAPRLAGHRGRLASHRHGAT